MPEFDVTVGNHDIRPVVTTKRVTATNERFALREAFKQLEEIGSYAWTVIDVKEVV